MALKNNNQRMGSREEGPARVITQKKSLKEIVKGILSNKSKFKEKDLIDAQIKIERYDTQVQKIVEPYLTPGNGFLDLGKIGSGLKPRVKSRLEDNLWDLSKLEAPTEEVQVHQEKLVIWYCKLLGIHLPSDKEKEYFPDHYKNDQNYSGFAQLKKELRDKYYK